MGRLNIQENELLTGISILAVLRDQKLEASKCLLVEPFLSYSKIRKSLARKNSGIQGITDLMLSYKLIFSNFNQRFYDKLMLSVNAIMLFQNMGLLEIKDGYISNTDVHFNFDESTLGDNAKQRISACKILAKILQEGEASELYSCLRIII